MRLIFGLDLGQSTDHSALAGVDRQRLPEPMFRRKFRYVIRFLDEYPLGMSYPDQVRRACDTFAKPAVKSSRVGVDYTGVGRPVYDILKEARPPVILYPMLTTGGHAITFDKATREYHVPKVEQVSLLQLLLQADLIAWHVRTLPTQLALGEWGACNAPASSIADGTHRFRVGLRHPPELWVWFKSALSGGLAGNRRSSKERLLDGREEVLRHDERDGCGLCRCPINLHCGS